MLGEFETVHIEGERLVRVRLFDCRYGVANLQGRLSCVFDEVMTEAVALRLSFDLWRDVVPCWMGRVYKEVKLSPIEALMEEYGAPMTRDEYVRWNNLGKNAKVCPEEEAELPIRFQSGQTVIEQSKETNADRVDNEVRDELIRYQMQVGRELTANEVEEIHQSPKMHGYIRWRKECFKHDAKRLRADGWAWTEWKAGNWRWERKQ